LHVPIYRSQGESRQRHHPPWMRIRWRCRMNSQKQSRSEWLG
jgi:hypothetical protein